MEPPWTHEDLGFAVIVGLGAGLVAAAITRVTGPTLLLPISAATGLAAGASSLFSVSRTRRRCIPGGHQDLATRDLATAVPAASDVLASGHSGERTAGNDHASPLTRSGLFEPPSGVFDTTSSGDRPSTTTAGDMANRLDPIDLRWLDSSPAEQAFLGWRLGELRQKSYLEVVHDDDRERVRDQLVLASDKGEVHGLVFRIRTASGKARAIVMNVGARYGPDMVARHLRCHSIDVTAKVRAERERRVRTQELTRVNEELRRTNRVLEELEERYRDLYENAPAMYFSVDEQGRFLECNDTLTRALGIPRADLVGRPYERILSPDQRALFPERFARFVRDGHIEVETEWVRADGSRMQVWVKGTAVRSPDGQIHYSRSVAQDVTARKRLEWELEEKNARLATTIEELSRRNKEMDEFTYVVSHDLKEPLRTLTTFSGLLLHDHAAQLDDDGRMLVGHIGDASKRMRSLIQDLLALSRAGRVTIDHAPVELDEVVAIVRGDLAGLIRSRNADLRQNGPLPRVLGDRHRIAQLIANLVTNGLKYNDQPVPVVEIGIDADETEPEDYVTFRVRDNGIGIDPSQHARIFQLFRRLHEREEVEGTGAGLAICEKIVQAHGGTIWVESAVGSGSTFHVRLPAPTAENSLAAPHGPPAG